jgi:hypothetical protein
MKCGASYCTSPMTPIEPSSSPRDECDANAVYVVDTSGSESEPESKSPLPPVYECTLDDVDHAPSCQVPSLDGVVQLSQEQMRAAVEFYDRSGLSLSAAATATNGEAAVDSYDCKREGVVAAVKYKLGMRGVGDPVFLFFRAWTARI